MKTRIASTRRQVAFANNAPTPGLRGKLFAYVKSVRVHQERAIANNKAMEANRKSHPEATALYESAIEAFLAACAIARLSRKPKCLTPEEFSLQHAKLKAGMDRARDAAATPEILERWPKTPGITFSMKAGESALDVALQFSRMMIGETTHFQKENAGNIAAWKDATVRELKSGQRIPPLPAWPIWEIQKDAVALASRIRDEYQRLIAPPDAPWSLPYSKKVIGKRLGVSRGTLNNMEATGDIELQKVNREKYRIRLTPPVKDAFDAND